MAIALEKGVFSAALGLGGAGAVVMWPDQWWIGLALIGAAALILLWGIKVNGQHWWAYRKPSFPRISLNDTARRVAYESDWGVNFEPGSYEYVARYGGNPWKRLMLEICRPLTMGDIRAWGVKNERNGIAEHGPTEIPKEYWTRAEFSPELMLTEPSISNTGGGDAAPVYQDVQLDREGVYATWPRAFWWRRKRSRFRFLYTEWRSKWDAEHQEHADWINQSGSGDIPEIERQEASEPSRSSGADFPQIGKAILDRYDGQAETFAYRKAVLQLSEVKATAMQRAGEKQLSKIACHMDIENHTRQQFRKCRVRLAAINGERLGADTFLRIGSLRGGDTETEFDVRPLHSKKRINFMKRDLDDVVSNPPFLLCLNDRDLPLSDGKEYKFVFALECEYEHPTYATVRFYVPDREKVEIELLSQGLDMPDA